MTKISNQRAYIPDEEINGLDYLPGTDFDQALKTVNFRVQDLGTHYNQVNGVRNFDYNFYAHIGSNPKPADGYFYSNSNEQDPNNITYFVFSKKTARFKDTTNFFESISAENPFDLIIAQKVDINTIFFFRIDSIETFSGYYKLNVSEVFFPNGKTLDYVLSYAVFNLKSEGGPTVTKTSELINDGSDATSTYVEADELGAVAFSNDYNDLDNLPTIPTVITNHSGLNLDDGTNPHGTTKSDVGLGNVDNTSDIDKPISTDTQTALDSKLNKDTTAGVERAYIINADGSQGTKATSDFISPAQLLEDFYNKSAKAIIEWVPMPNSWGNGIVPTVTGTADNVAPIYTGTYFQAQFRRRYASAGIAGSSTSFRDANFRHTAIGEGFVSIQIFGNEDTSNVAQARSACCLIGGNGEIGNVNPSTVYNFIGVANDSGQANLHFNVSNQSALNHNIDLGSSFPSNTNSTDFYLVIMINDKGVSDLKWRVVNLHSGADTGYSTITTGLPASTMGLAPQICRNNGSTALAVRNSIMLYRLFKM